VSKLLHGVVLLLAPVGRGLLLLLLLTVAALGRLPIAAGAVAGGRRRREYGGMVVVRRGHRLIPGLAIKNPTKKTQKTHLKTH
jgi:hypothetical protein